MWFELKNAEFGKPVSPDKKGLEPLKFEIDFLLFFRYDQTSFD